MREQMKAIGVPYLIPNLKRFDAMRAAQPDTMWGIDSSYDLLTSDEAKRLKDAGVEVYAQCLWTGSEAPSTREQSIANALSAGLLGVGYISVAPGLSGEMHVKAATRNFSNTLWQGLTHCALDVELPGLLYESHVKSGLDALAAVGTPRLVYTNYNTWVSVLGNPPWPEGTMMWDASWGKDPAGGFLPRSYGGVPLEQVIGLQFTGGEDVLGQYADRDLFKRSAFTPVVPPPVEDFIVHLTSDERTALLSIAAKL